MPQAAAHFKHKKNFTSVGNGKWLCNICKADVMTAKQAVTHERSAQHSSRAEAYDPHATSSAAENPTDEILSSLRRAEQERGHWTDLSPNLVSFWRKGLAAAERGEEAESMHDFLDKLEEELAQDPWSNSSIENDGWGWGAPAEDWTPAPDVWASAWGKSVPQVPAKVQQVHQRREGSSSMTSMQRQGTVLDRDEGHSDGHEDNPTSFVEKFLQHHAVDARRRERMRTFYEMPTDQKIRKIQEVIRDLRGQ